MIPFLYGETPCFMYFTQFVYKTHKELMCIRQYCGRQKNELLFVFLFAIAVLCLVKH